MVFGFGSSSKDPEDVNGAEVDPVSGRVLETPEIEARGLAALRARIEREGFRIPQSSDRFLRAFLRARKYNVAKACLVLKHFSAFWFDPANASVINGTTIADASRFAETGLLKQLPEDKRDIYGNLVSLLIMGHLNFDDFMEPPGQLYRCQLRSTLCFFFAIIDDDETQLTGITMLESLKGFSLSSAMKSSKAMGSDEQKRLMAFFTDMLPVRVRRIYILDAPWYVTILMGAVRPFLKAKLKKRFALTTHAEVHKEVPASILPPLFGGDAELVGNPYIEALAAREAATACIGGFYLPASVENTPTTPAAAAPAPVVAAIAALTLESAPVAAE